MRLRFAHPVELFIHFGPGVTNAVVGHTDQAQMSLMIVDTADGGTPASRQAFAAGRRWMTDVEAFPDMNFTVLGYHRERAFRTKDEAIEDLVQVADCVESMDTDTFEQVCALNYPNPDGEKQF